MSYADLVEGDRELGLVGHTGIGAALRDDLAGGGQRQLGEGGAYQLIHQHREEHDVAHHSGGKIEDSLTNGRKGQKNRAAACAVALLYATIVN